MIMTMIMILWSTRSVRYDYDCIITTAITTPSEQGLRRKLRPRANVELMSIIIHSHTTILIVILHWNAREHAHLFVFSRLSAYTCNSEYKYCSRRAFLWRGILYSKTENGERQYTPHSVGEDTVASPVISRSSNCFIHWRLYSSLVIPPFFSDTT